MLLGALALVGATGRPALAHSTIPAFHTEVTGVLPPMPGVTVVADARGRFVQLTNTRSTSVVVYGYVQDPYLRVGPDGVFENTLSPATYLNRGRPVPPGIAHGAPGEGPHWQRVSHTPVARWHDSRVQWTGTGLPPAVKSKPAKRQQIRTWIIPALAGNVPFTIDGTLSWQPEPGYSDLLVVADFIALAILAAFGLGWGRHRRTDPRPRPGARRRRWRRAPPGSAG